MSHYTVKPTPSRIKTITHNRKSTDCDALVCRVTLKKQNIKAENFAWSCIQALVKYRIKVQMPGVSACSTALTVQHLAVPQDK